MKRKNKKTIVQVADKLVESDSKYLRKEKICDRCGNDLTAGAWLIHLPHSKLYIRLCHICWLGLVFQCHKWFYEERKEETK